MRELVERVAEGRKLTMGKYRLDLGPVPRLELDYGTSCKCREHGDSQRGFPLLSCGNPS